MLTCTPKLLLALLRQCWRKEARREEGSDVPGWQSRRIYLHSTRGPWRHVDEEMGRGIMRGSNTPWAQGPANFLRTFIFQWIRSQLRFFEPYGGKSTPLIPKMTTRASIKISLQKPSFFHEFDANSAFSNLTGGNRPHRFPKWQRERRLIFHFKNLHFSIDSMPTPRVRTLRREIDPVDSENGNESFD